MSTDDSVYFGRFRFDREEKRLFCAGEEISLRPKSRAVLSSLIACAGRSISKDALINEVWQHQAVADGGLAVCIREIRKVLDDDPRHPQFLQTVHRYGYRFIGRVASGPDHKQHLGFVGRSASLEALTQGFEAARIGQPRVVTVSGEPGSGKTTLIEHWCRANLFDNETLVLRGECSEQIGPTDAYAPFLQAFRGFLSNPTTEDAISFCRRVAPVWMNSFSEFLDPTNVAEVSGLAASSDTQQMQQEFADFLAALCEDRPTVLILEDMHWCDPASAALLGKLARDKTAARLVILVSLRPSAVREPDRQIYSVCDALSVANLSSDISLGNLSETNVRDLVRLRLGAQASPETTKLIFERTAGHPFFLSAVLDEFERAGTRAQSLKDIVSIPGLVPFVRLRIKELSDFEWQVLEAASIAGQVFSAASLELALDFETGVEGIEDVCNQLCQRGEFLEALDSEVWPDGTVSGTYQFNHAFYPEIIRGISKPARRNRLNLAIANRLEHGFGSDSSRISPKLAYHFYHGRDPQRAVPNFCAAASIAISRHAHSEAEELLRRGQDLISAIADDDSRHACELELLLTLGPIQIATQGYSSDAVTTTFRRALDLTQMSNLSEAHFPVLRGLAGVHIMRADYRVASDLGEKLLTLDPDLVPIPDSEKVEGHLLCGVSTFHRGCFSSADAALASSIRFYCQEKHRVLAGDHGVDPVVLALGYSTLAACILGENQRSTATAEELIQVAEEGRHKFTLCQAHSFIALLNQLRGDIGAVRYHSGIALDLANTYGFAFILAAETARRGWLLTHAGDPVAGIRVIREGASMYSASGAVGGLSVIQATLAEAYLLARDFTLGTEIVNEALASVRMHGEGFFEAELLRIKGALLMEADPALAKQLFHESIELAESQGAQLWRARSRANLSGELDVGS